MPGSVLGKKIHKENRKLAHHRPPLPQEIQVSGKQEMFPEVHGHPCASGRP